MLKRLPIILLAGLPLICLCAILVYFLPPVNQRLAWRVENLRVQVRRALNPPEQVVFVPQEQQDQIAAVVEATLRALTPSPTITVGPTQTPSPTAVSEATPTPQPTAIPSQVTLNGIRHEYQKFNNCGPANLSMALSYWGWQGDQRDTAAFLRPGEFDKNVMPSEMQAFVEQKTDLSALVRYGGDLQMIKRLIAAGFPVVIEKGYDPPDDDWMGHYLTLNGYDDAQGRFTAQDSLIMPDFPLPYEQIEQRWRDFDEVYLVIFPPEREAEVLAILGPQADETYNYQYAAGRAEQEIGEQAGRDQYFAWFNLGTNRVALGDFAGAAEAYDQAFTLYPSIPEDERPWRVLWYEVGPYAAYYQTGRYQDVVNLANTTFFALGEYTLEESFYWRGLANEALGDRNTALFDLRKAVELNPNFTQAVEQLARLESGSP